MEARPRFSLGQRAVWLLSGSVATFAAFPVSAVDWQSPATASTSSTTAGQGLAATPGISNDTTGAANGQSGGWRIVPTISVYETFTDNVDLSAERKSDLITDISPGITIRGTGGRTKLDLTYQLHEFVYAQDLARRRSQNALNAIGTVELFEKHLYLEGTGMISQQSMSAFGGSTSTYANANTGTNTTEVSTYRLSPYFKGSIGNMADYQLRYNATTTHTGASTSGFNSDIGQLTGSVKGLTQLANFGWSASGDSQRIKFSDGRSNQSDQLRGVITYYFDPQLRFNLIGGREANDYLSANKEAHTIKGAGFEWAPTERTQVMASRESRFFGPSNTFSFSHRTAGTAWRYSESKDARVLPTQQLAYGLGTYYDLYNNMLSSAIPDPIARAAFVNALLLSNGIQPTAQMQGGFLTSGVTLQQRRELSFAINGVRNTVTFAATQTESSNLSQAAGVGLMSGEDFSNFQHIRQRGASVNWSHKLTENSTLNTSYSALRSTGVGATSLATEQKMFMINFLTKLGPKTNAGFGARRVVFDGTLNYTENALTGTLTHMF